jgi:hypothetical protein
LVIFPMFGNSSSTNVCDSIGLDIRPSTFSGLQPDAILAAQPKRYTGGVQVMLGSVEVDGLEFLCFGRADAEVAAQTRRRADPRQICSNRP